MIDNDEEDFISLYLSYTSKTECPTFFHRWTAITSLAAWIGRDIYFPFGHSNIYANMYVMLVGLAGTKKSTAIKIGAKVLRNAGYKNFAAKKTRQEKFLIDMAESVGTGGLGDEDNILNSNLFGDDDMESAQAAEVFVAADEVNNFIGTGNLEFMSILGELWDIDEVFKYRLKNSDSVSIPYPTITILGGNTFAGFNKLFPPEAIEQGFFSRMLFIYAEPKGRQYTIPPEPSDELSKKLIQKLAAIKATVQGRIELADGAFDTLDAIYHTWEGMEDPRFDSYQNRRPAHLLKLAMVLMASNCRKVMTSEDIIEANTILTFTEHLMPKALGEFGRARNSAVTHKIMGMIDAAVKTGPVSFQDIWKAVHTDLDNRTQLVEILGNLIIAEKIQSLGATGYLPVKAVMSEEDNPNLNWSILSEEERGL